MADLEAAGDHAMTEIGSRKTDATGRGTGRRKTNRRTKIGEQFTPRLVRMLASSAYRELSLSARRVLDRIEIELAQHGGTDNGRLPVTFDDFHRYGIHRHAIAPAIREAAALGFIEVTDAGRAGNADWRKPNLFRLTYTYAGYPPPTHEWQKIETDEEAKLIATAARLTRPSRTENQWRKKPVLGDGNQHQKPEILSAETGTTGHGSETALLSISTGVEPQRDGPVVALPTTPPAAPVTRASTLLRRHRLALLSSAA